METSVGWKIFSPVERSGAITGYNPTYKYFLGPIFCIRSPFIFFWGKEVLPTDMVKHLKYWFRFFQFPTGVHEIISGFSQLAHLGESNMPGKAPKSSMNSISTHLQLTGSSSSHERTP